MKTETLQTNEERINHLLWLLMKRAIYRYLMVNTEGRLDGSEKADRHVELSYIYVASRRGVSIGSARLEEHGENYNLLYSHIHDATRELTDYMDEVIGFPITGRPDYDDLAPKFFKEFIRLADEAYDKTEQG